VFGTLEGTATISSSIPSPSRSPAPTRMMYESPFNAKFSETAPENWGAPSFISTFSTRSFAPVPGEFGRRAHRIISFPVPLQSAKAMSK